MASRRRTATGQKKRTSPNRRARTRRKLTRRVNRFESALGALPLSRIGIEQLRLPALGIHGMPVRSRWHWSKVYSSLLLVCVLAVTLWLQVGERWYVYAEDVEFEELTYLDAQELLPLAMIQGWNILWIEPEIVRSRLLDHPYVADARVTVSLPNRVAVSIEEKQPVALWVTKAGTLWLLEDGSALAIQGAVNVELGEEQFAPDGTSLPQIIDVHQEARALSANGGLAIDEEVLRGALTILAELPGYHSVRYNEGIGINFPLPDGSQWVYWGDGDHMSEKLENLAAGRQLLREESVEAQIIDVRYPQRPYLR